MFKKLLLGLLSVVSIASAAVQDPQSYVFVIDSGYASHCAETIYTLNVTMPEQDKNVVVLYEGLDEQDKAFLTTEAQDHTRVILWDIDRLHCLKRDLMNEITSAWSHLVHVRWQLASIMDELNKIEEFKSELFDKKPITRLVYLDADLWILQDLSELFTIKSEYPVLSARLSPISTDSYEENEMVAGGVSGGVLVFRLDKIEDSTKFTEGVAEHLLQEWNEHKISKGPDYFPPIVNALLNYPEDEQDNTISFIQYFISDFNDYVAAAPIEYTFKKLEAAQKKYNISADFVDGMKKILVDSAKIKSEYHIKDLLKFMTDLNSLKTCAKIIDGKYTVDEIWSRGFEVFAVDETGLELEADLILPIKWNYNPKDLFPALSNGKESQIPFPEMHKVLMKKSDINEEIVSNASDVKILHFDGARKPWDKASMAEAIKIDPLVGEIVSFYISVKNENLSKEAISAFMAFLNKRADTLVEPKD